MLHLKKNHLLLFFWFLLFGLSQGFIGAKYGVWHQFLFPEYMGHTGFLSFALMGFSIGGFILAFNLYTYILHGFRFPFIVTLNRPFVKFSINNFIIPAAYLLCYLIWTIDYQRTQEILPWSEILMNLLGLFSGITLFLILSSAYFITTNKSIANFGPAVEEKKKKKRSGTLVGSAIHKKKKWYHFRKSTYRWRVETYMSGFTRISLAREGAHYDKEILHQVFSQNHINASLFEIALVITFIMVGSFREYSHFVIPAAASVVLFFTMMLMVTSALFSYVRGWTLSFLVLMFVGINIWFNDIPFLNVPNHAYGLSYDDKAPYDVEYIRAANARDSLAYADFKSTLDILHHWKRKQLVNEEKPKLVVLNCSGGGLRSALWAMKSLLTADSLLNGEVLNSIVLITGSSGGVIGAAYARELHLLAMQGNDINMYDETYMDNIASDLLNPVIFSMATNDFFIRYQRFEEGGHTYTKDRGYAFERQLNMNTGNVLNKRLIDYAKPERDALIPMLVMTPTIVNDGRRLIISAQPMSYLTQNQPVDRVHSHAIPEDVEFLRMFENQQASNLRFTSALRMNATFPYVMPTVTLPSDPPIDVMDAGLRDNFGTKTTLQFLYTFRNWINSNTSGVVILQTRDIPKDNIKPNEDPTLWNQFTAPLGTVYGNFTRIQDFNTDQMVRYLSAWFANEIDVVTFQLPQKEGTRISLSWHLTEVEKQTIEQAVDEEHYLEEVERLRALLSSPRNP
ncbi:MAG: hypothetical protein KDC12_11370 [Flavobacteriales bacterium]|nr:hypothetical protein [Flavobacteriales bacterium]